MAGKQAIIDGDISLDAIKRRCQTEQGAVFQLASIKALEPETVGNNVLLTNLAKFTLKDDDVLAKLTFVDINDKSDAEIKKIKKDMEENEKQTLLCDVSTILASKNVTKVLVFGKN